MELEPRIPTGARGCLEGPAPEMAGGGVGSYSPRIFQAQKDCDGKDGDAVGEADAARVGRIGTLRWGVYGEQPPYIGSLARAHTHTQHQARLGFVKSSLFTLLKKKKKEKISFVSAQ